MAMWKIKLSVAARAITWTTALEQQRSRMTRRMDTGTEGLQDNRKQFCSCQMLPLQGVLEEITQENWKKEIKNNFLWIKKGIHSEIWGLGYCYRYGSGQRTYGWQKHSQLF